MLINMDLRGSRFLVVFPLCLVYMHIIAVYGQNAPPKPRRYSQQEIDEAWARMAKRENYMRIWANQTGCWHSNYIPFIIRRGFTNDQIQHIFKHILQIQNKTCLRWLEKTVLEDYSMKKIVEFVPQPDNSELCGTQEVGSYPLGVTVKLLLGEDCFDDEVVIHEMMHALGLLHEHQRIDRDCYVKVSSWHVKNHQYKIIYDDFAFERWPYDKRSVTHYPRQTFVIKDKDERLWDLPWDHRLGDAYGIWGKAKGQLTCMDVQKLNYRFCGGPDFCDIQPIKCDEIEEQENKSGCKQLYVDIAKGVVTPTNKNNG